MKLSQNFTKTSRESPADEVSKNAQLLMRAGYVHKAMPGVYAYLPLGLKMLGKIENIVRKHMNSIGGQEVLMNSLHPKEWWLKANRWENVDVLFKLNSQTKDEYALACSHEEQVVPIAMSFFQSYKDLPSYIQGDSNSSQFPLCIYQIQTKFRDELRSKSGLLRGREFRMKDMYDFHTNKESQNAYYELVKETYTKIYQEIGLVSYATTASGGIFTTNISHEFQVECEAGEDWIYKDSSINEVYNEEMAPCRATLVDYRSEEEKPMTDHFLDGVIGVEALMESLGVEKTRTTKTIFFEDQAGNLIVACVRGDRNVNEAKLMNISKKMLSMATEKTVMAKTGCGIGYAGVINLPKDVEVYFDYSVEGLKNFETGTNKQGYHTTNVCFGRDLSLPSHFVDISIVQEGDKNPLTDSTYEKLKSAEVGNIFKLDDKYTKAFGSTYMDENGKPAIPLMNCHGIGTSRCMAILAELYSDEKGLALPPQVAPFELHLITHINPKDEAEVNQNILKIAQRIYDGELKIAKLEESQAYKVLDRDKMEDLYQISIQDWQIKNEILWDDRAGKVSIGEKLKDADLIGCPLQVVVSKKSLESGGLELIERVSGEKLVLILS
jgi:prolyl-tRNA synthetase